MRHLVTIAPNARVLDAGPRVHVGVAAGRFRILEGVSGVTPFELQATQVSQETAEAVASMYPEIYRIDGEVDELERLFALPDGRPACGR